VENRLHFDEQILGNLDVSNDDYSGGEDEPGDEFEGSAAGEDIEQKQVAERKAKVLREREREKRSKPSKNVTMELEEKEKVEEALPFETEILTHVPFRFGWRDRCSICCQLMCGFWLLFDCVNVLCCLCTAPKGSRRGGCCSRNRRLFRTYQRATKSLEKELDLLGLIKRVREHEVALRASVLCSEERRGLLKHAQRCVIDIDSSDPEDPKKKRRRQYEVASFTEDAHGACKANEELITANIQ
jgi:hypothetical protein